MAHTWSCFRPSLDPGVGREKAAMETIVLSGKKVHWRTLAIPFLPWAQQQHKLVFSIPTRLPGIFVSQPPTASIRACLSDSSSASAAQGGTHTHATGGAAGGNLAHLIRRKERNRCCKSCSCGRPSRVSPAPVIRACLSRCGNCCAGGVGQLRGASRRSAQGLPR